MFVGHLFRRALASIGRPGLRVLDLCAAPGGKTTDLAASLREAYGDDFLLVSNEFYKLLTCHHLCLSQVLFLCLHFLG